MRVKLRIAGGESWQQLQQVILVHLRILQQAEHGVRVKNSAPPEGAAGAPGQEQINQRVRGAVSPAPCASRALIQNRSRVSRSRRIPSRSASCIRIRNTTG